MRKKKAEPAVASQGVELPGKHGADVPAAAPTTVSATVAPATEGVIDLDPATVPVAAVATAQAQKTKRKYTKRAKETSEIPTLVDFASIRNARIKIFTDYVDGKVDFEKAAQIDDKYRKFAELASEVSQFTFIAKKA
jgi:hypothetical protein